MFRGLSILPLGARVEPFQCKRAFLFGAGFLTRSVSVLGSGRQDIIALAGSSVHASRNLHTIQRKLPEDELHLRYFAGRNGNLHSHQNFSKLLSRSGQCIAGFNTSVFREMGYSHSLGKRSVRHCSTEAGVWYQDFAPVVFMQDFMQGIHSYTHLPWWATIIVTTLLIRTSLTLPLAMYQANMAARMELLNPTVNMMREALQYNITVRYKRLGKSEGETQRAFAKEFSVMVKELYRAENISSWKMFSLPLIQIPLFWFTSLALRNLSGAFLTTTGLPNILCPELATEGILWFSDLTVPDPYYILPVLLGLANYSNLMVHSLRSIDISKRMQIFHTVLKYVTIFMVIIASELPAAMSLYWTISASYGLAQSIMIKYPYVRRILGIPKTDSESETPIANMFKVLQQRVKKFLEIQREGMRRKEKKDQETGHPKDKE